MGRVDEGMTAAGDGEGEGVAARVGLSEGVALARTAAGGPADEVADDVGA